MSQFQRQILAALSIAVLLLPAGFTWAGGGPENVFLVVNSADPDSMAVANHFIDIRGIPTGSVFYVDWPQPPFEITVGTFRDRLLQPILDEITARQLTNQIDYIIYSSGFPYAVNFAAELGDKPAVQPKGSITGLTFHFEHAMQSDWHSLLLEPPKLSISAAGNNAYATNLFEGRGGVSRGFRAKYGLDVLGERVREEELGRRYYLSMMLGYTGGNNNNTVSQIKNYLSLGVRADGTNPKGTIYYVRNGNVRSQARDRAYEATVSELEELGVNAELIDGGMTEKEALPVGKNDVQGAMVGYFKVAWGLTNSKILPGAIVENFTSYGGVMNGNHSQTLLANFLRFGTVASSGTVCEPYAIGLKFPHPRIHVHYAKGCSVAEAFYQSVVCPYQLLIVGDPLCQPWASPPQVQVTGLDTKRKLSGVIQFQVTASSKSNHTIRNFEIFVDGKLISRSLPDQPIEIDTTRLANGYHDLRVIAIEDTPIETQGRHVTGFVSVNLPQRDDTANSESSGATDPNKTSSQPVGVVAQLSSRDGVLRMGQPGIVHVRSAGAATIRLYRGRDIIGSIRGESGRITVDPDKLGSGPVTLRPVAFPKDRTMRPIFGFPLKLTVTNKI